MTITSATLATQATTGTTGEFFFPSVGSITNLNYSDGTSDWVSIRNYNWDQVSSSAMFQNPSNLPLRDDYDFYERTQNIVILSRNQLAINTAWQQCTATISNGLVTAVTVNPTLTGYKANQVVSVTLYQTNTIYGKMQVTADANGNIASAQFINFPTGTAFTTPPMVLIGCPDIVGNTTRFDVGPQIALCRETMEAYPAPGSFLGELVFIGTTGTSGTIGGLGIYGQFFIEVVDPSPTTTRGRFNFCSSGTATDLYIGQGIYGALTPGGDKGQNTANFNTYYQNGISVKSKTQSIRNEYTSCSTGTCTIPFNNTAPQSNQGFQVMSASITPSTTSSTLRITITVNMSDYTKAQVYTAALFRDSGSSCIAAQYQLLGSNAAACITFTKEVISGSTNTTTFNVRIGANNPGTVTFNGYSGANVYGGTLISSIEIEEFI